jgi:hypothetical protein
MNSSRPGNTTSTIEITSISAQGIWIQHHNEKLFLSYAEFPWFKDQPVQKIRNVQELAPEHLYWPDIDVDLCLDSIRKPGEFPLKARV